MAKAKETKPDVSVEPRVDEAELKARIEKELEEKIRVEIEEKLRAEMSTKVEAAERERDEAAKQRGELEERLKRATAPPTAQNFTAGPAAVYRVKLPGVKVRTVDDEGRIQMVEHLDVTATSTGDAFEKFKRYNGILSTSQVPEVGLAPDDAKPVQVA